MFYLCYLLGLSLLISVSQCQNETSGDALHCNYCTKGANLKASCDGKTTCQDGEVCYIQIADVLTDGNVNVPHYYGGCVDDNRCSYVTQTILKPDGTIEKGIPSCGGCCNSSECNHQLCGMEVPDPVRCGYCPQGAKKKADCNDTITCKAGEVCFAQIAEIPSPDGISPTTIHYYSGCVPEDRCQYVKSTVLLPDGTIESGLPLCGSCCSGGECNKHVCRMDIPDPVQCIQCPPGVTDKEKCTEEVTCKTGEVCFTQVTDAQVYTGKTHHYYKGCVDKQRCPYVATNILRPDGTSEAGIPLCGGCCTDTNCNADLCDVSTSSMTTTTANATATAAMPKTTATAATKPLQCGLCVKPRQLFNCEGTTTCNVGEVCYAQVSTIAHFLFGDEQRHYYSGCVQEDKCTDVQTKLLQPDGTWESQKPLCGGCCSEPDCNKYLCNIHQKPPQLLKEAPVAKTTTSFTTTTPDVVITKSKVQGFKYITTTMTTTRTTPTTTTTTPTTITATTAAVTTTIKPLRCSVCSGASCTAYSGLETVVQCDGSAPYCLLSVYNTDTQAKTFNKSCVTRDTCEMLWWTESSNKHECITEDMLMTSPFSFTCHLCCTNDNCNTLLGETFKSLYQKETKSPTV